MSYFDSAVERAATMSAGLCVAALDPTGVSQGLAAAAVAGVGLSTLFHEVTAKSHVECRKHISQICERVKQRLIAEDEDFASQYEDAAQRLSDQLLLVLPGPEQIAALARHKDGLERAGAAWVMANLGAKGQGFDRDPKYARFAGAVISTALDVAIHDQKLFPKIEVHFWLEALSGIGAVKDDTARLLVDASDIKASQARVAAELSAATFGKLDIEALFETEHAGSDQIFATRPTAMLVARYGAVPFLELNDELAGLLRWCASEGPLAGRLYSGRGGVGKTRLLLEACRRLNPEGQWLARFLSRSRVWEQVGAFNLLGDYLHAQPAPNILLVIDYAEMRSSHVEELASLLTKPRFHSKRIRVVCIARASGDWWRGLTEQDGRTTDFFDAQDRGRLDESLPHDLAQRFWTHCATAFAPRFGLTEIPSPPPIKHLARTDLGDHLHPLPIAIDAYLKISGARIDKRSLLAALAARERPLWMEAIGRKDPRSVFLAEGLVSSSTLLQGVEITSGPIAETPLSVVGEMPGEIANEHNELEALAHALAALYPLSDALGPIEPDILGEHIVGAHLLALEKPDWKRMRRKQACAGDYLTTLWSKASSEQRLWLLTVLNRATRNAHNETGVAGAADRAIESLKLLPFDEPEATAQACLTQVGRLAELITTAI